MAAFPLYSPLICPNIFYKPDFLAGSTPCTLQSGDVTRSRLLIGGSFFRSTEAAGNDNVNGILLTCTVTLIDTTGDIETYDVDFDYTDANGTPLTTITVAQVYNTDTLIYTTNGIDSLRAALVGNLIVTMPTVDVANTETGWGGYNSSSDSDHITAFTQTPMEDALTLPTGPSGIRTGPTYTLYHIARADTAADGSWEDINAISEWDGVNSLWIAHPSTLYEVGDPAPCP